MSHQIQVLAVPLNEFMSGVQLRIESVLDHCLPKDDPEILHQAMRYAVLGGGKRIRPILTYATGELFGVSRDVLDMPAAAVEIIHAYSLIHDDLPAMDDDDLRRGKPSCHIAFDEATAILAGDALQAQAFILLSDAQRAGVSYENCFKMMALLAKASGSHGMAGGQAIDLSVENQFIDVETLERIHRLKTGKLIEASILLGALCSDDITPDQLSELHGFGQWIGLAFQIQDDILDVEGCTETLGKQAGSDVLNNKPTYPSLFGIEKSKQLANEALDSALSHLDNIGAQSGYLRQISEYIVSRDF